MSNFWTTRIYKSFHLEKEERLISPRRKIIRNEELVEINTWARVKWVLINEKRANHEDERGSVENSPFAPEKKTRAILVSKNKRAHLTQWICTLIHDVGFLSDDFIILLHIKVIRVQSSGTFGWVSYSRPFHFNCIPCCVSRLTTARLVVAFVWSNLKSKSFFLSQRSAMNAWEVCW